MPQTVTTDWESKIKSWGRSYLLDGNFQTQDLQVSEQFTPAVGVETSRVQNVTSAAPVGSNHGLSSAGAAGQTALSQDLVGELPKHTLKGDVAANADLNAPELIAVGESANSATSKNKVQAFQTGVDEFDWKWNVSMSTHKLLAGSVMNRDLNFYMRAEIGVGDIVEECKIDAEWNGTYWRIGVLCYDENGGRFAQGFSLDAWEFNLNFDHFAKGISKDKKISMLTFIGQEDLTDNDDFHTGKCRGKIIDTTTTDSEMFSVRGIITNSCVSVEETQS